MTKNTLTDFPISRKRVVVKSEPCDRCGGTGKAIDQLATGQRLRAERKTRRVSLAIVAEQMGYSVSFVSDLEFGRRLWSGDKINAYEKAIGL